MFFIAIFLFVCKLFIPIPYVPLNAKHSASIKIIFLVMKIAQETVQCSLVFSYFIFENFWKS